VEPVVRLRAAQGLPPRGNPLFAGQFSPSLTLALFSPVLALAQPDWPPNTRMTGFFHLSERVSSMSRAIAAEPVAARKSLAAALSSDTLAVSVEPAPLAGESAADDEELAELEDIMLARLSDSGITDVHVERNAPSAGVAGATEHGQAAATVAPVAARGQPGVLRVPVHRGARETLGRESRFVPGWTLFAPIP